MVWIETTDTKAGRSFSLTVSSLSHVYVTDEVLGITPLLLCLKVATQFKSSLLKLTEILMAKEAWYIRCLKSNESKQPGTWS